MMAAALSLASNTPGAGRLPRCDVHADVAQRSAPGCVQLMHPSTAKTVYEAGGNISFRRASSVNDVMASAEEVPGAVVDAPLLTYQ